MMDLGPLRLAIGSLDEILRQPMNEFVRDGVIQRFEYTFELSWKAMQRLLKLRGVESGSPTQVLRAAHKEGLIVEIDQWMAFLKSRNLTVHTYNKKVAEEVFKDAEKFPKYVHDLLRTLQANVKSP